MGFLQQGSFEMNEILNFFILMHVSVSLAYIFVSRIP